MGYGTSGFGFGRLQGLENPDGPAKCSPKKLPSKHPASQPSKQCHVEGVWIYRWMDGKLISP
jgi:hypothetical protein